MEITSGKLTGFKITAPDGMNTRPTAVRARKALFDSLGNLSGQIIADLFAGSGALGMEALSRGADSVYFAECAPRALRCIRKNMEKVSLLLPEVQYEIIPGALPSSLKRLSSLRKPVYIFADPPYELSAELLDTLLKDSLFTGWASDAVLIWETDAERGGLKPPAKPWKLVQIRNFGAARFLFLAQEKEDKNEE